MMMQAFEGFQQTKHTNYQQDDTPWYAYDFYLDAENLDAAFDEIVDIAINAGGEVIHPPTNAVEHKTTVFIRGDANKMEFERQLKLLNERPRLSVYSPNEPE